MLQKRIVTALTNQIIVHILRHCLLNQKILIFTKLIGYILYSKIHVFLSSLFNSSIFFSQLIHYYSHQVHMQLQY